MGIAASLAALPVLHDAGGIVVMVMTEPATPQCANTLKCRCVWFRGRSVATCAGARRRNKARKEQCRYSAGLQGSVHGASSSNSSSGGSGGSSKQRATYHVPHSVITLAGASEWGRH